MNDTRPSFSQQFEALKGTTDPDVLRTPLPKPSREAQSKVPGAARLPFTKDIYARAEQRPLLDIGPVSMSKEEANRKLTWAYFTRYVGFIVAHYYLLVLGPRYFSWANLGKGMLVWCLTGWIGIGVSFHRQLTHRSFQSPKWLEYLMGWLGTHAYQGHPAEWVSNHRAHHLHADTPLDLHSPYEGFFWSHFGWFSDFKARAELPWVDYSNAKDLTSQWFYRFLEATWFWQFVARFYITYAYWGTEGLVWTLAWPLVYGWHVAFLVASAGHMWGYQSYETDDLSQNNWWSSLLTFGECWHNNHHAFPFSARHGLEWYELDLEWAAIKVLGALGLAWDIQVPTESQMAAKRKRPATSPPEQPAAGVAAQTDSGSSSPAGSVCSSDEEPVHAKATIVCAADLKQKAAAHKAL